MRMSDYQGPERRRRRLAWQNVALILAVALAGWSTLGVADRSREIGAVVRENSRLARENSRRINDIAALTRRVDANADQSTSALCALRRDLEKRVDSSRQFLREHPHGIPGISAKTIRDGLSNQQRTIRALRGLSCRSK